MKADPPRPSLTVAIPCFNEAAIVRDHLLRVLEHLRRTGSTFELLVCDDTSTDGSPEILAQLQDPELRIVRFADGPSRRENLALAMREARGEVVVYMDMDLSSGLDRLDELVTAVREGRADVAIGSRRLPDSETRRSVRRRLFSYSYNAVVRFLFASRVLDHQCGFKAMRQDTLRRLLDLLGYDSTFQRGWFWDAELLIRAQHLGLRIAEIPIRWHESAKSSFRFRQEIRVAKYMLRSRARILRGRETPKG